PAFPDGAMVSAWVAEKGAADKGAADWAAALTSVLEGLADIGARPLAAHVAHHRQLTEDLAQGTGADTGTLWQGAAGKAALALMDDLAAEAAHGGTFTPPEYRALFDALLNAGEVREAPIAHPLIRILGPREAREAQADLVILGGLTDGVWPRLAPPDPWLNRKMRAEAGLLLPERQIGLAAHDYQQAVAAGRVVLTRAVRDAEAETVPSRWLNRLVNLMQGLPDQYGPQALSAMQKRGAEWLALAEALERPTDTMRTDPGLRPARRPAPQPPLATRPRKLSLSNIGRLIRDPYAIYARSTLGLYPMDPLKQSPDPRDRGTVFHEILERFVRTRPDPEPWDQAKQRLMQIAKAVLDAQVPYPAARLLWLARLGRAADHFLTQDAKWGGVPLVVETQGAITLNPEGFTLYGTPDRIDRLPDGTLHLIDYKTGTPPTQAMQREYEKQLIAAAALAERGGFADLGRASVSRITYVGLGAGEKAVETAITEQVLDRFWDGMTRLIADYGQRETGYAARRAMFQDRMAGDYDHLARYGEWQMTDRAEPQKVGPDDP
ncbi:MAG: PD-(D/E)XK nuclease family protein, partial [Paracoccaceae bacterium]